MSSGWTKSSNIVQGSRCAPIFFYRCYFSSFDSVLLDRSRRYATKLPSRPLITLTPFASVALKCDLREDRAVSDRLARYNMHTVQYEEGLTVARRIRASRYLGRFKHFLFCAISSQNPHFRPECSSKHNRGVNEVFYEAARVSLSTRAKGSGAYNGGGGGCIIL